MALLVLMVLTVAHTHERRSLIVGIVCILCNIMMYASPLAVMVSNYPNHIFFFKLFSFDHILILLCFLCVTEIGDYNKECGIHAVLPLVIFLCQWSCLVFICSHPFRHLLDCKVLKL